MHHFPKCRRAVIRSCRSPYGVLQNPRLQTIPSSEAHCRYFDPEFSQLPHYCILSGICRKIATGRDRTAGMSPTVLRRCRYRLLLHPLIYRACRNRHSPPYATGKQNPSQGDALITIVRHSCRHSLLIQASESHPFFTFLKLQPSNCPWGRSLRLHLLLFSSSRYSEIRNGSSVTMV